MAYVTAFFENYSGVIVKAIIHDNELQFADIVNEVMETYDAGDLDDYGIVCTQLGLTGEFYAVWPSWLTAGNYTIQFLPSNSGFISEAAIAKRFGVGNYYWDGTVLKETSPVDVAKWNGTAVATPSVAGVPEVDVTHIVGNTGAANSLKSLTDVIVTSGTAQGPGANSNQIQLAAGEPSTSGIFDPSIILLIDGAGSGQSRRIIEYDGITKIAVVSRTWKINPDNTTEYAILADPGGLHVNEGLARGSSSNTIIINALASSYDDAYNGQTIFLVSGAGEDQARICIDYDGISKTVTVDRSWDEVPDTTTGYLMLPALDSANIKRIDGDIDSLTRFKRSVDAVKTGTVVTDVGNTALSFLTDLTVENSNYYGDSSGGLVIAFIDGTVNQYQTRRIVASVTSGSNTFITLEAALDAIPSGSDAFVMLGRITELS